MEADPLATTPRPTQATRTTGLEDLPPSFSRAFDGLVVILLDLAADVENVLGAPVGLIDLPGLSIQRDPKVSGSGSLSRPIDALDALLPTLGQ